ncbi:MAG: tannase/feruloyl esterase family alpha/beta hydrolase [Pseudomonadales bacterium]|nr:tannase/feruloyl esterase family alpha/beta hydrolase [Pseudomonadales bacterium]
MIKKTLVISAFLCVIPTLSWAQSCENLNSFNLPNVRVDSAEVVVSGSFSPPAGNANSARLYQGLPEFCRVALTLTPTSDSDIKMELWLPTDSWNGKYLAVGNGAFTGSVRHSALAMPLSRGYAASSTDTGHLGNTASFALGHPEKVYDFAWRAVHEMAETSKALIDTYYADGLNYSYFTGCSAGGRQAMKAAQRFPEDFDGIVAGAPGLDWTGRAAASLRIATHLEANPAAQLKESDRILLHRTALDFCDAEDGVTDGLIGKPAQCSFAPEVLQCDSENAGACLTEAQVNTAQMIYSSPANPVTGRAITGLLPGSELGWTDLGWTNSARATGLEQYRYLVYEDENWSIDQFEFERDSYRAERKDDDTLNALSPDLFEFVQGGGKLIAYHGWADPQISPANATQYFERVTQVMGGRDQIHDSVRLFMAPGMGHCAGGPGPNSFDSLTALENWVESGKAPDSIIAVHRTDGVVDMSRPLCPHPEVAVYDGSGSTNEAENFVCQAP